MHYRCIVELHDGHAIAKVGNMGFWERRRWIITNQWTTLYIPDTSILASWLEDVCFRWRMLCRSSGLDAIENRTTVYTVI